MHITSVALQKSRWALVLRFARRVALLLPFLGFVSTESLAQSLHPSELAKTSAGIIEKAKRGISQDLYVILNSAEIEMREQAKRRARGLPFIDRQILEETKREYAELKATVLPTGTFGDAVVIEDHPHVAVLTVRVPNAQALFRILAHPKVKAVDENKSFSPAAGEHEDVHAYAKETDTPAHEC